VGRFWDTMYLTTNRRQRRHLFYRIDYLQHMRDTIIHCPLYWIFSKNYSNNLLTFTVKTTTSLKRPRNSSLNASVTFHARYCSVSGEAQSLKVFHIMPKTVISVYPDHTKGNKIKHWGGLPSGYTPVIIGDVAPGRGPLILRSWCLRLEISLLHYTSYTI